MSRIEEALTKAARFIHEARPSAAAAPPPPLPDAGPTHDVRPADHMLLTVTAPHSQVSEEFKKLKEAIIKESRREGFSNMVLVTSANPREGKTSTSLNLAVSLAQEFDYTVLLVDADLRAASCHKYLGLDAGPGLSDCLAGRAECADVLQRTGIGRLVLLQAGEPMPNPVELISSSRMRQLLQEIKHRYPDRFIIIDSPPVNMFAETRFLAGMADASILVVREGVSSLEEIGEAVRSLDNRVVGIVYNDAREASLIKKCHYSPYYVQAGAAG